VGRVSRTAVVAWALVSFAGCASIAGLDGITESNCAPNCGDSGIVVDSSMPQDTGGDTAPPGDTMGADTTMAMDSSGSSSGADTGTIDTGIQDSQVMDTFVWDGPPFNDAPFDSGCGDLNTTTNCGACGDTCAGVNTVQTSSQCCSAGICPGSTNGSNDSCQYTCANGYLDCNASIPPDTDGCECHVPGAMASQCCGTGCPIQHNNGLNQASSKFYDCVPTSAPPYPQQLALDACIAYVGAPNASQCGTGNCVSPDGGADGDLIACAIMSPTACVCWTYAGPNAGYFHNSGLPGQTNCFCADKTLGDQTWN
jgi:hypothetical protein